MKNRIGIVGGGQLGRMLSFEAKKMGFTVIVIDPTPNSPAGQVVDEQIIADFYDQKAIRALAGKVDFLTSEIEFSKGEILDEVAKKGVKVNPSAKTFTVINDKFKQKQFLQKNRIPVADFVQVETREDILKSAKIFGFPILLKARFDAYDGRGNALIKSEKEIESGMQKLSGRKLYVEKFVPFIKEIAVVVARSTKGEIATYPVIETIHKNNILHTVFVPARIDLKIQNKARKLASKVMEHLKGAGVFGIEMFLTKDPSTRRSGQVVLVNEIAPRVHNSGHFTIEATITNQFEQHIRAITGLPLGKTDLLMPAVMVNILGDRTGAVQVKGLAKALEIPNVSVHIYGKAETRPERKMGHITVIDKSLTKALKKANLARALIEI